MSNFEFRNKENDNYINMYLDSDKTVWIDKYFIDNSSADSIEMFYKTLQDAFIEMKNRSALSHKQYVATTELDELLEKDDRWELISKDDNVALIECDIDD